MAYLGVRKCFMCHLTGRVPMCHLLSFLCTYISTVPAGRNSFFGSGFIENMRACVKMRGTLKAFLFVSSLGFPGNRTQNNTRSLFSAKKRCHASSLKVHAVSPAPYCTRNSQAVWDADPRDDPGHAGNTVYVLPAYC